MLMMWPRPASHHLGQHQLASREHAVEVHLDRGPDRLLGLLEERADGHHAGIVDQHVDVAAAVGARLVEERRERLPIGDVEGIARNRAELGQIGDGRFTKRDVAVADDHPRAPREQGLGGRISDAPCGAGDRDRLAPDVVHAAELYTCQVWWGRPWPHMLSFGGVLGRLPITLSESAALECARMTRVRHLGDERASGKRSALRGGRPG